MVRCWSICVVGSGVDCETAKTHQSRQAEAMAGSSDALVPTLDKVLNSIRAGLGGVEESELFFTLKCFTKMLRYKSGHC